MYHEFRSNYWNFEGLSYWALHNFMHLAMVLAREALTKKESKRNTIVYGTQYKKLS